MDLFEKANFGDHYKTKSGKRVVFLNKTYIGSCRTGRLVNEIVATSSNHWVGNQSGCAKIYYKVENDGKVLGESSITNDAIIGKWIE